MKKSTKVWLGIATIWPVLYVSLIIVAVIGFVALGAATDGHPRAEPAGAASILVPVGFMGLLFLHLFTIVEILAVKVFYILRVFKTEQLDQNMRIMWTLLLVFLTIFAEPVFWYLYIWRDPPTTLARQLTRPTRYAAWEQQSPRAEQAYVPPSQPPDWR